MLRVIQLDEIRNVFHEKTFGNPRIVIGAEADPTNAIDAGTTSELSARRSVKDTLSINMTVRVGQTTKGTGVQILMIDDRINDPTLITMGVDQGSSARTTTREAGTGITSQSKR